MGAVKVLYRCEQMLQATCSCDSYCNHSPQVRVSIHAHPVAKATAKGWWIREFGSPVFKRWVSASGKKRFAHPTIDEAVESFKRRKQRQITILKAQLEHAEAALNLPRKEYTDCTKRL